MSVLLLSKRWAKEKNGGGGGVGGNAPVRGENASGSRELVPGFGWKKIFQSGEKKVYPDGGHGELGVERGLGSSEEGAVGRMGGQNEQDLESRRRGRELGKMEIKRC